MAQWEFQAIRGGQLQEHTNMAQYEIQVIRGGQVQEHTNMAQDEIEGMRGLSHEAAAFLDQVPVAGSMGSILAYAMLSANVLGQGICVCAWSHRLMEGSVKDCHLHAGH